RAPGSRCWRPWSAVAKGRRAAVLVKTGVPGVRHQRSGAGAAIVFVQQHVWRVPGVQWTGQQVRLRSGEGSDGLVKAAAGRRAGAGIGVAEPDPFATVGGGGVWFRSFETV